MDCMTLLDVSFRFFRKLPAPPFILSNRAFPDAPSKSPWLLWVGESENWRQKFIIYHYQSNLPDCWGKFLYQWFPQNDSISTFQWERSLMSTHFKRALDCFDWTVYNVQWWGKASNVIVFLVNYFPTLKKSLRVISAIMISEFVENMHDME